MATPGSGYLIANDLLNWISNVLIEPVVDTTMGTAVTAGTNTVTPGSMTSIYVGAQLIVGSGSTEEVITVTAVTTTTLTAVFVYAHAATDALYGATFPVGENNNPFFQQSEVLSHLSDSQNDFLTRAPIVLAVTTQNFGSAQRTHAIPDDAIQVERVAVGGKALWEQGQTSHDLLNRFWPQANPQLPDTWYEDRTGYKVYGVEPIPLNTFTAELVYAQRDNVLLALNEGFLLPDPFLHYVMYGTLAELFGKDGEQRDSARAQYCEQRFAFGIRAAQRLYDNVMAQQTINSGAMAQPAGSAAGGQNG